jgi:hypothetical protein
MKKQTCFNGVMIISGLALGLLLSVAIIRPLAGSQFVIFGSPVQKSGSQGACPGAFSGYNIYTQAPPAWGWAPATNTAVFTVTNGGQRADVRIEFTGEYGDSGCNLSGVTIPNPPASPQYTFNVYFRSNPPPTTNYPIILTGFNTNH